MNATFSFMNQFLPIGFSVLLLFILFYSQRGEPQEYIHTHKHTMCWEKKRKEDKLKIRTE